MIRNLTNRVCKIRFFVIFGVSFVLFHISFSADANTGSSRKARLSQLNVFRDQVYAPEHKAFDKLDIYVPRAGSKHPVVMFFHGGKFCFGDKSSSVFNKPNAFTSKGFVFVSVDYRLSPTVKYPAHVEDVAASIAWVRKNIERYGADPKRIYVMGHSAGAQLAALVATDAQFLAKHGLALSSLKGAILLDGGSYNLTATAKSSPRHDLLRSVFGRDSRIWWQASPIKHIERGKDIPAFLIVYIPNRADATAQALAFNAALCKAGIHSTLYACSGTTHASLNEDLGLPHDKPSEVVFHFLARRNR